MNAVAASDTHFGRMGLLPVFASVSNTLCSNAAERVRTAKFATILLDTER
jgi:hypothetical protein